MYYKPTCKPVEVPAIVKPLEPWRQLLLDTAHYIREHGWTQYQAHDGRGAVCLTGALLATIDSAATLGMRGSLFISASNAIQAEIVLRGGPDYSLPRWNDQPGRTVEEVLDVLEAAARSPA